MTTDQSGDQSTEQPTTMVTDRMRELQGVCSEPIVAPPIGASDIRKWAIAVYWPVTPPRIHWDAEYARTTRWGGIVAPVDFNPFAWLMDPPQHPEFWESGNFLVPLPRPAVESSEADEASSAPGTSGMNGGQVDTNYDPMRPGDVIEDHHQLLDWNERPTSLGLTLFIRTEHRWTNQHNALVRRRIATAIRY